MKHQSGLFYGWYIAAAGFVILFMLNGAIINTFGVFLKPVSESMGWSRVTFSIILGVGALGMALGSPFVGRIIDAVGAGKTMLAGSMACGLGMAAAGAGTKSLHFYLIFAVVGVGLAATTMIPVSLIIANWFERKRGMAMGLAFMGTSVGGMMMNPVNTYLVQTFGWRKSYVVIGIATLIITIPLIALIIRTRPSEMGLFPDGDEPSEEKTEQLAGHTPGEARRTSAFWFISTNMFLTSLMANAILVHGIPFLTDIGHSEMVAAVVVGLSMGFMTLGKVGLGLCADRWGARRTFALSAVMTALGIVILMQASPLWVVILFAFVFGFPQGGPLTLSPMVAVDCHGLANFGAIFGLMTFFSILGAGIGPVIVGAMYDASGTYEGAFTLLIILTLISAYCIHRARPAEDLASGPVTPH